MGSTANAGNWHVASNWSPASIPALLDRAIVGHAMTVASHVACGDTLSLASIIITSLGQANITSTMVFATTGHFYVSLAGLVSVPSGMTAFFVRAAMPGDLATVGGWYTAELEID